MGGEDALPHEHPWIVLIGVVNEDWGVVQNHRAMYHFTLPINRRVRFSLA